MAYPVSGTGDCTNFVSQVRGGGMYFHGSDGGTSNATNWYYYGSNIPPATKSRSYTWTGAYEFRQHWGNVNGSGGQKAYQMRVYTGTADIRSKIAS